MALSKFVHGHTLTVPGLSPSSVTVKLDTTGQHTFSWYVPIALEDAFDQPLPPGSLNLYLFPTVTLDDGSMITPEGPRLDALKALLKAMVVDDDCTFATKPDEVGATIHAIVVANTEESCKMSEALFEANPKLYCPGPRQPSRGLPSLCGRVVPPHLLRQPPRGPRIELMMSHLTWMSHWPVNLAGVFFEEMPMKQCSGGTALSYALCFSLKGGSDARYRSYYSQRQGDGVPDQRLLTYSRSGTLA